ncbi:MAG: lysophospholipase [Oligoflexia bacterium]|nr:lysophospholipase [Oligoflexia bacterium]
MEPETGPQHIAPEEDRSGITRSNPGILSAIQGAFSAGMTRFRAEPGETPEIDPTALPRKALSFGIDLEEELPKEFVRHAQPVVLQGRVDAPVLQFYGGLGQTSLPCLELARLFNQQSGYTCELYSLEGHQGSWRKIIAQSEIHWVRDVIERAERVLAETGNPTTGFGFSTGGLTLLKAAAERPELFSKLVLIGTPLELRNRVHVAALEVAEMLASHFTALRMLTPYIPVPLAWNDLLVKNTFNAKGRRRLEFLPLSRFLCLKRLQLKTVASLTRVSCPVIFVHGSEDEFSTPATIKKHFGRLGTSDKYLHQVSGGHMLILDGDVVRLYGELERWLEARSVPAAVRGAKGASNVSQ